MSLRKTKFSILISRKNDLVSYGLYEYDSLEEHDLSGSYYNMLNDSDYTGKGFYKETFIDEKEFIKLLKFNKKLERFKSQLLKG